MLLNIFQILAIFWLIRTTKVIFFYLYLWQLKEYHIGRFIDHFRTEKGKRLLFNGPNLLKIILLIYFFALPYFLPYFLSFLGVLLDNPFLVSLISLYFDSPWLIFYYLSSILYYFFPVALLIIYLSEDLKIFLDFFKKRVVSPVFTKKAVFLTSLTLIFGISVIPALFYFEKDLNFFPLWLLILDIFLPLIISIIFLFFQPLAVFLRSLIIIKAKRRKHLMAIDHLRR